MANGLEELAEAARKLGDEFADKGQLVEARTCYTQALVLAEQAFGKNGAGVAEPVRALGQLALREQKLDEADGFFRRLIELGEGSDEWGGEGLAELASVCTARGDLEEAEELLKRSLAIKEVKLGSDHFDVAMRLGDIAALCERKERWSEARPLRERMIVILARRLGPLDRQVARLLDGLADLCEKLDDKEAAAEHRTAAGDIRAWLSRPHN